jgi:hypothetical protein
LAISARPAPLVGQGAEELQHRGHVPAAGPAPDHPNLQVLLDGEAWEDAPTLGDHGDAEAEPPVGGHPVQGPPVEGDGAGGPVLEAGHGPQQGRLAGPVGPDHGHRLALVDRQRHVEQGLEVAVEAGQPVDLQQRHA